MRGKFSFLYVDIWFDVTKCKFIVKNSSFEMLVVFSSIFVADTKITFVYNFVAPLNLNQKQTSGILSVVAVMVVQGCSVKKVFLEISQTKRVFL